MNPTPTTPTDRTAGDTRRDFIKKTSTVAAGAAALTASNSAWAAGSDEVKIGLIGSGGRGSGAAAQALSTTNPNFRLHAVGDAFKEKADSALSKLRTQMEKTPERVDVTDDRVYGGLDAYKEVIDKCDLVILTTPPGFRPYHFEAAVNAGKNIFMEKPVATDAPGVRKVLEMAKVADEKNLKVVVGLQRRYQNCYLEALKQVKEQDIIGEIVSGQVYWNGGGIWFRDKVEGMSELQYQINNWYFFTYLCGDHINEQHIHNIDVANWFIGSHPESAQGMGGRQQRVDKKYGQIYDHHYVEFTYANGVRVNSQCRHQAKTLNQVREEFTGTKGKLYLDNKPNCYATDHTGKVIWRYRIEKDKKTGQRQDPNPYQTEHDFLQECIIQNKPVNNAYYGAHSTMTSIMGRMATYSGQEIKWDEALGSKVQLMPSILTWESEAPVNPDADGWYPIAIPGETSEGII
ncbi:MAG: Gfo/Idh/MocA family oxidoreductase [Verrucomicrobiales bacterium]|nr:Gfo/Idh/MocA family oxidoreductase [Verrucomicrobiales bacterium]